MSTIKNISWVPMQKNSWGIILKKNDSNDLDNTIIDIENTSGDD